MHSDHTYPALLLTRISASLSWSLSSLFLSLHSTSATSATPNTSGHIPEAPRSLLVWFQAHYGLLRHTIGITPIRFQSSQVFWSYPRFGIPFLFTHVCLIPPPVLPQSHSPFAYRLLCLCATLLISVVTSHLVIQSQTCGACGLVALALGCAPQVGLFYN
jgi:hypothetical protein